MSAYWNDIVTISAVREAGDPDLREPKARQLAAWLELTPAQTEAFVRRYLLAWNWQETRESAETAAALEQARVDREAAARGERRGGLRRTTRGLTRIRPMRVGE